MIRLSAFADEADGSLSGQIKAICENGLKYTDVRNIDGKNVLDFTPDESKSFARAFESEGISVACIGSPLGKSKVRSFDEFLPDLDKILRTAEIFRSDRVRIFSFYESQDSADQVFDCLTKAVEYAAKHGVKLYHENELGIFGEKADKCVQLINATGCGCVYDPANFVLVGQDIPEAEKLLLPYSDFYHVKDARKTGEIVPAGYGDADIPKLLDCDDILLTVEPHLMEFAGYGGLTERGMKKSEFGYSSPREAFDAGVTAVKAILNRNMRKSRVQ